MCLLRSCRSGPSPCSSTATAVTGQRFALLLGEVYDAFACRRPRPCELRRPSCSPSRRRSPSCGWPSPPSRRRPCRCPTGRHSAPWRPHRLHRPSPSPAWPSPSRRRAIEFELGAGHLLLALRFLATDVLRVVLELVAAVFLRFVLGLDAVLRGLVVVIAHVRGVQHGGAGQRTANQSGLERGLDAECMVSPRGLDAATIQISRGAEKRTRAKSTVGSLLRSLLRRWFLTRGTFATLPRAANSAHCAEARLASSCAPDRRTGLMPRAA